MDQHRKQISFLDKNILLSILDTYFEGLKRFSFIKENYSCSRRDQCIRGGSGFLIMYDILSKESFENSKDEIEYILRVKDEEKFPMVLIGNKCDLEDLRVVTSEEGMKLAKKYEIPFFETSAKVCINVEESIFSLIQEIYKEKEPPIPNVNSNKKDCLLM
jgi:GTPase KRas